MLSKSAVTILFSLVGWLLFKAYTMGSTFTKLREVNSGLVAHTTSDCTQE